MEVIISAPLTSRAVPGRDFAILRSVTELGPTHGMSSMPGLVGIRDAAFAFAEPGSLVLYKAVVQEAVLEGVEEVAVFGVVFGACGGDVFEG